MSFCIQSECGKMWTGISSIVNEVVRAIDLFFLWRYFTQKKAYKAPKQRLLRYSYTPKSIIKHTDDFHPDIMSRSIKSKQRLLRYFLYA